MLIPYLLWCFSQKTWDIFWCWSLPGGFVWKWGTFHSPALSSGQSKIWWSSGQSGTPFLPSIRAFFLGMSQLFLYFVHGWAENGTNSSHFQVAILISKHRAFRRGKASWRSFPTDGCTAAGQSPVAASGCWSCRCCMRIRCLEMLEVLEVVKRLVGENGMERGIAARKLDVLDRYWYVILSIPLISQSWRGCVFLKSYVGGLSTCICLLDQCWSIEVYMYKHVDIINIYRKNTMIDR